MCASLHASVASASRRNAPLHVCEANASLTKRTIFDILYSKDGDSMANDKLSEQSMDFAVHIINLVKQLKRAKGKHYFQSDRQKRNVHRSEYP